jgi:hypothetical protein
MEETPKKGKKSSHSVHVNGMNEWMSEWMNEWNKLSWHVYCDNLKVCWLPANAAFSFESFGCCIILGQFFSFILDKFLPLRGQQ